MVHDINRLARLHANWDSYGAAPLNEKAARHAVALLLDADFGGPAPWVSPSPDGSLHMEWGASGFGLEVIVDDAGDVNVVVDDGDVIDEWATSIVGDDRLVAALHRVATRV